MMMTYKETTDYLFNCVPLFQNVGKDAYKEGLYNTEMLDEHFGHPHRNYKTIHIGGTNGKGSCSHTLAAILQKAGYKVGLYTSPHLTDFRERIRVNGEMIPEDFVVRFVENERHFFEPLHPSFFELTTAMAFLYFAEEKVDVAVIEVGLGGRLDCTNIIKPDLAIITNISFDHIQFLGNTLAKIANEKAGIIKENTPVVIGETTGETRPVFYNKALSVNAKIYFAEEKLHVLSSRPDQSERIFQTDMLGELKGELGGLCQEKNCNTILTAVDVLRQLHYPISDENIREGFLHVCKLTGLRGRWQTVAQHPLTICDTGHNTGGMQYISEQLKAFKGNLHIVIGMVNDKDVRSVLKMLPRTAHYYFTKASVKRALNENELQKIGQEFQLSGQTYPNVETAYQAARSSAAPDDMIFIGGSTFIVADFFSFFH